MMNVLFLIPIYNDFASASELINRLNSLYGAKNYNLSFILIDDNSSEESLSFINNFDSRNLKHIKLVKNMGHQRAIAIGLSYIADNLSPDYVVVMDGDGEDKPEHVELLLDMAEKEKNRIVFAARSKRHESLIYRFFYMLYKTCFLLLTGKKINFGNFSVIPKSRLKNIVQLPEIWIHYSGAVVNSKIPYCTIALAKGKRFFGKTKMNFTSLIIHGLSAMAVHVENLVARLLVFSIFLVFMSFISIVAIIFIKLFTDLAIPGWATTSVLELLSILIQAFFISLLFVFFILHKRVQPSLIPIYEYKKFIDTQS